MPKSVNIPGVGVVNFPDAMSNEQISSVIKTEILPKYGQAPKPPVGQGGALAVGASDFITGLTDAPAGIASILGAIGLIENPEESVLTKFSEGAKAGWQDILGVNPEAERTTAETAAGALGSVGSFFVPGAAASKATRVLGGGARAAKIAGRVGAGAVAVPMGAQQQAERIERREAAGETVSPGEKSASILFGATIGLADLAPLERFFGPLEAILAKVPLSKAGTAAEIMETGIKRAATSATAEGAQEAISQLAQNLVEKGIYNPELDVTEGLLANAAAGGFAGGTIDVILQLMAGRKIRKANTARSQLETQIDTEIKEAAPEVIRAQAIEGLNTLRTAAPSGAISVVESQMPGDQNVSYYIVGADKKPLAKFSSIDAAIAAGKQYEADSNGVAKFEPPTITELVKMRKAKTPKLTKAQKNQARQEAKRLKAAGQLQPAPTAGPATTPEGQATTAASIEKIAAEDNLPASQAAEAATVAPKKGRKKIAPVEPLVEEAAPPLTDTAAEITLPEPPTAPAAELTADQRVALWKSIAPQAQTFRDLTPEQQATYFEAVKKAEAPTDQPDKLSTAPAQPPAAAAQPAPTGQEIPEGFREVKKEVQPTVRVALRPLESTPEGAAKAREMDAKKGRVADALNKVLTPIVAKNVRLNLVSHLKQGETYARGAVNPEGTVIDLALDIYDPALTEEQLIDKLTEVMNHEVIHTLRNANLLTPAEITTLFNATDKIKYQGKAFTYFDRAYRTYATIESYTTKNEAGDRIPNMDMINEEAVAEMFRDYRAGKLKIGESPKGIFNKIIQFFTRMFRGFRDAEVGKVFTRIESGEVGARKRRASPAVAAEKLSAVPPDMRRILEPSFRQFQAGEITREEWNERVNTLKPVRPYPSVPEAPSLDEVRDAIGAKGEAKGVDRIGLAHRILKTGDRVKSRLDIPAYENKGVWVETIRSDDGKFEGASYDRAGMFTNVKFDVKQRQAELVAAGENDKSPFAVIEGDWVDVTPEQIQARAEQVFNDPEWRQVGMDPTRHSYFYDRKTMEPVVSAEEVIQIGPLVLAKNAKTAPAEGFKYSAAPALGTKEFKEWFGRSKVLDTQGQPLVVHHFGSFSEDEDIPRSGMHFGTQQAATDRAVGKRADDAAMSVEAYQNDDGVWHFDLGGVTSEELGFAGFAKEESAIAYGRSEALEQAANDNSDPLEGGVVTSAYLSLQNPKRMADLGGANGEWDAAIEQAKAEGYDGIVYRNQYEDKGSDSYIAFEPTQIKSVNNRGTFSKEDARIKFSVAPAVGTEEFSRWFKQSKAVNEDGSPMVYYRGDPRPLRGGQLKTREQDKVSGGLPDKEGPFFFSPRSRFAESYSLTDFSKGGTGRKSDRGVMYPVFLSVQNPWDYNNPDHVQSVLDYVKEAAAAGRIPTDAKGILLRGAIWPPFAQQLKSGNWRTIELPIIQRAIRNLGFDGFHLVEGNTRNLAVFDAAQVKSVFNQFEPGTATSKKLSVSPTAYEAVPFVEKPAAIQRQILGDVERMRRKAVDLAKDVSRKGDTNFDNSANAANIEVRNAVRKLSAIPQPQPQSAFFQAANATLFATVSPPTSPGERLMDLLGGLGTSAGRTKILDAIRVNYVQKQGQIAKYQRIAELAGTFESGVAEYSAIASSEAADRASHQIPNIIEFGAGEVMMINNDPNSKYFIVNENETENAPKEFFKLVYTGGPNNTSLMDQFKTILVARAVVKRQKEGKPTPIEVTPEYIRRAEDLALQYPVLEDAYNRYQKFNKKMIKAAVDSGFISQETFEEFTDDMNYYSLYREVGDETLSPPPYGATGRATNIKAYKGSEKGNLIADPMEAMIRNISFWTSATMRNIAAQKAHRVAMTVGIGRNLKWLGSDIGWESPDPNKGEDARYLSYNIDGKEFRYAVTDPLFATGLLNTEGHNMGLALELLGMPTTALRELVTRDPGFMIANLLRDSISTWILAGSGASPLGTFIGLKKSLTNHVSFQTLKRMGVVGSYDEAQKSPRQMITGLKANIVGAQGFMNGMGALRYGWDRLGKLSDASDAATRIAVYEAAIKEGATEYTAAYRALSVMNFSRRGASTGLSIWTKLIPFLNARIQGFDVLYTGIKAGVQLAQGAEQTAFEKQRGAAVWYRGAALMAGALALAMINEDDEDYKQIPQYIKDANFLIPLGGSKFASIPKPFEAGLIFGTVPTTLYDIMRGNRSTRSGIKLFTSQLGSTFGFNPMPQVALPLFENLTNSDFYTGMPLISPGMQKLDPSLQYNASTSYVARALGKLLAYSPFGYDFESGRFEGVSPIMIDNLITGYGGPIGGYVSMGIGGLIGAFGEDNQGIPIAGSNLPVIKRFFIDAQDRQPQSAAAAYEVYQLVDKATRTASRLKKMGDVEALKEFREENIDLLRVGKQVRKMAENLNNVRAQVRRLEVDTTMSGSEKKARMRELRAREIQITRRIDEINAKLGR